MTLSEQLRELCVFYDTEETHITRDYLMAAADEITRLTADNERLRNALNALLLQALQSDLNSPANEWGWDAIAAARAALEQP